MQSSCPICTKSFKNLKQHTTKMHKQLKIVLNGSWPECADNWEGTITVNGQEAEFYGDGDAARGWFVEYCFIWEMKVYRLQLFVDNKIYLFWENGNSMWSNPVYKHNLTITLNGKDAKPNLIDSVFA